MCITCSPRHTVVQETSWSKPPEVAAALASAIKVCCQAIAISQSQAQPKSMSFASRSTACLHHSIFLLCLKAYVRGCSCPLMPICPSTLTVLLKEDISVPCWCLIACQECSAYPDALGPPTATFLLPAWHCWQYYCCGAPCCCVAQRPTAHCTPGRLVLAGKRA